MTIRKEYPPRDYETFPGSDGASNATHPTQGGDADKSRSAAEEAQRLASEGSWFTGGTPATDRTPAASTVDGEEVRSVGYPHLTQDADPSDPPPEYTPSASTQAPSSPVAARSEPDGRYQLPNVGSEPSKPSEKPWPPPDREHRERETSGTITGTFKLYDLLDLSTTSGSIFITVDVQSGDKPAVLRLATTSGSIRVKMSSGGGLFRKPYLSDTVQTRRLISDISTQSGSVSGDVVHGNGGSTSISTKSGSIHLTVYTAGVSELDAPSSLATSTGSGSQLIKVVPPFGSTEAVRAIEASHTVHGSGSVSLQYPTEWEGMLHAQIHGSGSLTASGAGLDVRRESRKELYAYKGSKQGRTVEVVEFGSGSVRFSC